MKYRNASSAKNANVANFVKLRKNYDNSEHGNNSILQHKRWICFHSGKFSLHMARDFSASQEYILKFEVTHMN